MRRFLGSLAATAVALVLVLGYKTHVPLSAAPVALSKPNPGGPGLGGAAAASPAAAAPPADPGAAPVAPAQQAAAPAASAPPTGPATVPAAVATTTAATVPVAGVAPPTPRTGVQAVVPVATKAPLRGVTPTRGTVPVGAAPATSAAVTGGGNAPVPVAAAPTTAAAQPKVYTGKAVAVLVFLGNVQVQITVVGGHITDCQAVQLPGGSDPFSNIGQDVQQWRNEVIATNGQKVDSVSGATDTYNAYMGSLNDAIAQAERG